MTTLIVGCGYLGARVGRRLVERNERVIGTVRTAERARALEAAGVEPHLLNVLNSGSVATLPDCERMIYCVGFDRSAGATMRAVYVEGLRAVLENAGRSLERLVYTSSTGVYGGGAGDWVNETSPAEPAHESGRVCLEAEGVVQEFAARASVSALVLRLAGLYGPNRVPGLSALRKGDAIRGDSEKFLNMIHVDDAARAVVAALDSNGPGHLYLVGDDRPSTRLEFYTAVSREYGTAPPRFVVPEAGSPEASREGSNKRVSNARMKDELGVSPEYADIIAGLAATHREEGEGGG